MFICKQMLILYEPQTICLKKKKGPSSEAVVTINTDTLPHMSSALLLILALTFDRAAHEHTRCHGDPKPLHSSAYRPVNGSPLQPAQCDAQFSQHCHFDSPSPLKLSDNLQVHWGTFARFKTTSATQYNRLRLVLEAHWSKANGSLKW